MSEHEQFDLAVIGTGVAASTVAYKCRSEGWSVAVIDSRPFGGTCALRGCDPKKVLVGAAEALDMNQRMSETGIITNQAILNWQKLMHFKKTFTESVPDSREKAFQKEGIVSLHGSARFTGQTSLVVGENRSVDARHILIATGAKPAKLPIKGHELMTTSDEFLELEELPRSVVFVGGGYISFEFAHISARAGADVTIIHRGRRPLENFDPDLVDMLVKRTKKMGINVRLQSEVKQIERKSDNKIQVHFEPKNQDSGEETLVETEMVVHGAGRLPDIDELCLEKAGIEHERKGVKVNKHLQSASNSSVFAAGDCAAGGGLPLTPVATYEGQIAAENLLLLEKDKPLLEVDYRGTPSVVFTLPPIASVGLQEQSAKDRGMKFKTNHSNTAGWYSSRRINESHSGYKVLVEDNTGKIIGAHLFGPHADEVINIFAMAMRLDIPAGRLGKVIWSYPTNASDINYMT